MDVNLTLPPHAVRFLARVLEDERARLAEDDEFSLQHVAAYDSLNVLEGAIPSEFWP